MCIPKIRNKWQYNILYNLTKVKINRVILLERETETNKLCKIARGNQRIQFIISA